MAQSMNGVSFFSSSINDTDNLTVNNISCNNISSNNIATTGISADNLFTNSINTTEFTTVQVTTNNLDTSSLSSQNINTNSLTVITNVTTNTVTAQEIATANVTTNTLTAQQITTANLTTNTLTAQQIITTGITGTTANFTGTITGESLNIQDNIECENEIICKKIQLRDSFGAGILLEIPLLLNLENLTSNVQNSLDRLSKDSGGSVTTGINNVFLSNFAGQNLTTGSNNLCIGNDSGFSIVTTNDNICLGRQSGIEVIGNRNVCIGSESGQNTQGLISDSVCIGNNSRFENSNEIVLGTSMETTIIKGELNCKKNITCKNLTIEFGVGPVLDYDILINLQGLTYNVENTFSKITKDCANSVTTGISNLALGNYSLPAVTTGNQNIAIGADVMTDLVEGSHNISIGSGSGSRILSDYNICIGYEAGQDTNFPNALFTKSTALGYGSKITASNQVAIGSETETVVIRGKIECSTTPTLSSHLVNKSYVDSYLAPIQRFGSHDGTYDNIQTVFFNPPFPVGTVPIVMLTLLSTIQTQEPKGTLFLADYHSTYFSYSFINSNNAHAESTIAVNYIAMIS
jgi:hypothetical protein